MSDSRSQTGQITYRPATAPAPISPDKLNLYQRTPGYIPRVAAVHDLCGYGKCSLGIAIPVLSAAGIDVCPVPTAFLSSHLHFRPYTFTDTSSELPAYLDAWQAIGVELDGIYSGFLANPDQADLIKRLSDRFPHALRIVDPVMGDRGRIYDTYDKALCDAMRDISRDADLLTPNVTEACILAGIPYCGEAPDRTQILQLEHALRELNPRCVVLKAASEGEEGQICNYIFGRDLPLSSRKGPRLPYHMHGTGDLFCSAITAALYAGKNLVYAVDFASSFVYHAMLDTRRQPDFINRGVSFELRLGEVAALLHA